MASSFPPVRACIFDVDGLLINSEDIYSDIYNIILHEHNKPSLPWHIKALQQSRGTTGHLRLLTWSTLPLALPEWKAAQQPHQHLFGTCTPLPGAITLLQTLASAHISTALASSSSRALFATKTGHLPAIADAFEPRCRVFGDDAEMADARKKPRPDIFLLALGRVNEVRRAARKDDGEGGDDGVREIRLEECLVFEDSIAGVEAGRRAGMRVVWVPHSGLRRVCRGREMEVLEGRTEPDGKPLELSENEDRGEGDAPLKMKSEDGWAEMIPSLEDFDYSAYGIQVSRS